MAMETSPAPPTRVVVSCGVLAEETSHILAHQKEEITLLTLELRQHEQPHRLQSNLQNTIDRLEKERPNLKEIIFVYGLCSGGIAGLKARNTRLIFPRAHDCLALFLGSRERYEELIRANPRRYWYTPGWLEGAEMPGQETYEAKAAWYRQQFDEEEAEYLIEMQKETWAHYDTATWVDLGTANATKGREKTRHAAEWLGWKVEYHKGDKTWLEELLLGPWKDPEKFLVLNPGNEVKPTWDERIMEGRGCQGCPSA